MNSFKDYLQKQIIMLIQPHIPLIKQTLIHSMKTQIL
jgi:hypothetical protein